MEQKQQIDLEAIRAICKLYVEFIDSEDYHEDNDYAHYIFETTLEAVYGKEVWDFINAKTI